MLRVWLSDLLVLASTVLASATDWLDCHRQAVEAVYWPNQAKPKVQTSAVQNTTILNKENLSPDQGHVKLFVCREKSIWYDVQEITHKTSVKIISFTKQA